MLCNSYRSDIERKEYFMIMEDYTKNMMIKLITSKYYQLINQIYANVVMYLKRQHKTFDFLYTMVRKIRNNQMNMLQNEKNS